MSGLRGILSRPRAYELWSRIVGGERGRSTLVREYVRPRPGARVLDLGCGPGELVGHLGDVRYVGVDVSEEYIEQARRTHGDQAEFRVGDATALDPDLEGFDLVLAFGVIHHLDDAEAERFLQGVRRALVEGGRFVSVDPTHVPGDSRAARLLVSWDRGEYVRPPETYARLVEAALDRVRWTHRRDLLRVPYTHCIVEASRP